MFLNVYIMHERKQNTTLASYAVTYSNISHADPNCVRMHNHFVGFIVKYLS